VTQFLVRTKKHYCVIHIVKSSITRYSSPFLWILESTRLIAANAQETKEETRLITVNRTDQTCKLYVLLFFFLF